MMVGLLVSSIVAGNLISRIGTIKPFIIAGTLLLTAGFAALGTIDHSTPLLFVSVAMVLVGTGMGMTIQNFILVVQNAVQLRDIGTATSTVSFFRSLGGTIGVSILGAVLARQVAGDHRPTPVAYGEATGHIFLISAGVAVVGVVAALLLKPVTLRSSVDLPEEIAAAGQTAGIAEGAPVAGPLAPDPEAAEAAGR
jgi:MFS family permease